MNQEQAIVIALQALGFIVSDEERVNHMQLETGLSLGDLKEGAAELHMQSGVLDYVLAHEQLLIDFSTALDIKPETIMRARANLPGFAYDA
jgi:Protein of unknown function (DUF3572)